MESFLNHLVAWSAVAAAVFTGLLVIVGWRGVNAAIRTLRAVEEGSKAAWLNAQALINSERPWMVIDTKEHGTDADRLVIFTINKGNTPAEIVGVFCTVEPQDITQFQPIQSPKSLPLPKQGLTVSGADFEISQISFSQAAKQLGATTNGVMVIFVRIVYWDTFTDRTMPDAQPHVSECYLALNPSKRDLFRFATERTRHT